MNMIYKDETLYVDIMSIDEINNINHIKKQLFSVLNEYEMNNVVINIMGGNYNKKLINDLIYDYHRKYKGKLIIDIK
jgi:hypothetical protein